MDSNDTLEGEDLNDIKNNDTKQEYIESIVNNDLVPEYFYKVYYSYENDPDFWINLIENTKEKDLTYRFLERKIIQRVKNINNNKLDTLFGLSNSRVQNIHNIEMDFICQYYSFGIIGSIILLGIYLIMLIFNVINLLKNFNFINFINLTANLLFCFCAYLTGNIICSITMIIVYSFLCSYFIEEGNSI